MGSANKDFYNGEEFADWLTVFSAYEPIGKPVQTDKPISLLYDEIGELWSPIDAKDDWSMFNAKLATFERA